MHRLPRWSLLGRGWQHCRAPTLGPCKGPSASYLPLLSHLHTHTHTQPLPSSPSAMPHSEHIWTHRPLHKPCVGKDSSWMLPHSSSLLTLCHPGRQRCFPHFTHGRIGAQRGTEGLQSLLQGLSTSLHRKQESERISPPALRKLLAAPGVSNRDSRGPWKGKKKVGKKAHDATLQEP